MKRTICLALASGLALLVAGCASTGGGAPAPGGGAAAPGTEPTGAAAAVSVGSIRNFNLAVKCPGIHWEKTHGWTEAQITQQEAVESSDIVACEQWVASQPKGYVPPPPPGFVPKTGAPASSGAAAAGGAAASK